MSGAAAFSSASTSLSSSSSSSYYADDYKELRQHTKSLFDKALIHNNLSNLNSYYHYVHKFCNTIQAGLLMRERNTTNINGNSSGIVDPIMATKRLENELGKLGGTLGQMPDFSNIAALRGYTINHFGRSRLLSRLITHKTTTTTNGGNDDCWLSNRMMELFPIRDHEGLCQRIPPTTTKIASLGGGPGYDYVCFASLYHFRQSTSLLEATIYEYEPGWGEIVKDVDNLVQDIICDSEEYMDNESSHQEEENDPTTTKAATASNNNQPRASNLSCGFESSDITSSLDSAVNEQLASSLDTTQIFTCSYVIAENAVRLRQEKYPFFQQLFEEAEVGSLFFFTDTTHRLWPDLIDIALETSHGTMRISIPHLRCGKVGWQLAMLKDDDSSATKSIYDSHHHHSLLTPAQQQLYEKFKAHDKAHQIRLDRGKMKKE